MLQTEFFSQLYAPPAYCMVPFGAYMPGITCAQVTVRICASKIGFSAVVVIHADVPMQQ